jgi:Tfp pilus assembly protein PilV
MTMRNDIQRRSQCGSTLFEALVAFLVLSLGMIVIARVQGHLRLDADVARQRSEAIRLAQEDMETLRGFATIEAEAGTRSFDDIASASRSVDAGTVYLIDRRIATADLPHAKSTSVTVSWTDRSGTAQQVTLHSIIAGSDPALTAALALAPR